MTEQSTRRCQRRYDLSGQVPQKEAVGEEKMLYMGGLRVV